MFVDLLYACHISGCTHTHTRRSAIAVHVQEKHLKSRPYACDMCPATFKRLNNLNEHVAGVHGRGINVQQNRKIIETTLNTSSHSFICDDDGDDMSSTNQHQSNDEIQRVVNKNPPAMTFICPLCKCGIDRLSDLANHFSTRHPQYEPYCCGHCQARFRKMEHLEQHILKEHKGRDVLFRCHSANCSRTFSNILIIWKHVQEKHTNFRPFVCDICGKAFKRAAHLRDHELGIHNGMLKFFRKERNSADAASPHQGITLKKTGKASVCQHKCHLCKQVLMNVAQLADHVNSQHPDYKPYCCGCCEEKFTDNEDFVRHTEEEHEGRVLYRCEFSACKFITCFPNSVQKHLQEKHTSVQPFVCQICDKSFKRHLHLREHMGFYHQMKIGSSLNTAPYSHISPREASNDKEQELDVGTDVPSSFFTSTASINVSDKRYKCPHCQSAFYLKNTLQQHVKQFHPHPNLQNTKAEKTGEMLNCHSCNYATKSNILLNIHQEVKHGTSGNVLTCYICAKTFSWERSLRSHMQFTHRDQDKPLLKCDKCEYTHRIPSRLKDHMDLRHSDGVRKYDCDICGRLFAVQRYVGDHKKVVHGIVQYSSSRV